MCVSLCQTVDGEVVMLSAHWEKRRTGVVELEEQLQQVPAFLSDLETVTSRIGETPASADGPVVIYIFNRFLCLIPVKHTHT